MPNQKNEPDKIRLSCNVLGSANFPPIAWQIELASNQVGVDDLPSK